ncbi:MAG: hypothetical protein ACXABY_14300, partial [Candidatus Thorarchaeota archaeon]
MSISERQRDKALEVVTRELLKKGIPPDILRVSEGFAKIIPDILGEPSFRFVQQPRRGNLKVDAQNKMFAQAADDLSILYEENIETLERYLSQLALLEIQGRRYGGEIRTIQKHLEDLLLTSERATNFFFGVGDTFLDLSQVDQARSDVAIDVGASIATLAPDSRSKKIPMAHLLSLQTGLVSIRQPSAAAGRIVPGAPFGNAFEDTLSAWQYQVLTQVQSPTEIAVLVPVVADGEAPIQVSRVTLQGLSATPYSVQLLWARDGVSFSPFIGLEEPRLIVDEFATLDFPEQLVTHIQLIFRKNGPDGEETVSQSIQFDTQDPPETVTTDNSDGAGTTTTTLPPTTTTSTTQQTIRVFSTVFAFKNIGVWSMGYKSSGTLVSKTLFPQDSESLSTIGKVAITVDETVPAESSIRYEIASNLDPEVFVPISPMNRPNVEAPQIVDFSTVQRSTRDDNAFTIDDSNPPVSLGTIRGTEFFSIASVSDAVVDKTARLWRGINAWTCLREEDVQIEQIRNLLIDFSDSDTQRLYLFEEEERIVEHGTNDGTAALKLRTRFPILLEGDSFNPAEDLRAPSDTAKPNFAIRKLIRRPAPGTLNQATAPGTVSIKSATENAAVGVQSQPGSPTAGRAGAEITLASFSSAGLLATTQAGSLPDLYKSDFRLSYTNNGKIITGVFMIESA